MNEKAKSNEKVKWLELEKVLSTLQKSLLKANTLLSKEKGEFQFVLTDFNISFPAELRIVEGGNAVLRLPSKIGNEIVPALESHLARVSFSLKPVPTLEEAKPTREKNINTKG